MFKSCFIRPGTSCAGDNLKDVDLSNADLSEMDFTGAYMKNANLRSTTLDDTNFTDAYMKGADFSDAIGDQTKLGALSRGRELLFCDSRLSESDWHLILAQ